MSEPFLAEIRMFGFNFAPRGWAFCDGQILPINQNQALFSLLGTTYGGDGRTTFALPDLRGRVPAHPDSSLALGQKAGEETVTLSAAQMPPHTHAGRLATSDQATSSDPTDRVPAQAPRRGLRAYAAPANAVALAGDQPAGDGQSHNNVQPSLAISFAIALQGLFPSRN